MAASDHDDESQKNGFTNPAYEADAEDTLPRHATVIDVGVDALYKGSPRHVQVSPTNADVTSVQGTSSLQDTRESHLLDTNCGFCCWTPSCLRRLATGRFFVFFCSILSLTEAGLTIGYISSAVTSIEKHFNFNSTLTGFVISCYDIGTLLVVLTSYYGGRPTSNRPKWIAWSAWTMALGACIVPLSHFVTGNYYVSGNQDNSTDLSLCVEGRATPGPTVDTDAECNISEEPVTAALACLIPGMLLIGVGSTSMFTLGTTYIDDFVRRSESPILLAIFFCTTVVGPGVGFGVSFLVLGLYVDFNTVAPENVPLTPDDPEWVGAWWLGYFICAAMIALPAIPVYAYPASLPKPHEETMTSKQGDDGKAVTDSSSDDGQMMMSFNSVSLKQMPRAIWNLFKNPVYMIINIASAMEFSIVSGFVRFSPKFIQYQFNLPASTANLVTGTLVPSGAIGVIVGGIILNRVKRDLMSTINILCAFTIISGLLYGFLYIPEGCYNVPLAGVTTSYINGSSYEQNLTSSCNSICQCSDVIYSPVCGSNGVKYFSPCHAGCLEQTYIAIVGEDGANESIKYTNCSCIDTYNEDSSSLSQYTNNNQQSFAIRSSGADSSGEGGVTDEQCEPECNSIIPFIVILLVVVCVTSVVQMPALLTVLRSVKKEERPFALGLQFVIIRLLGYIPAPIYYGATIDSACILWQTTCSDRRGACLEYDNEQYFNRYLGLSTGLKFISMSFAVACWIIVKRRNRQEWKLSHAEATAMSSTQYLNQSNGSLSTNLDNNDSALQHQSNGIAVISNFKMADANGGVKQNGTSSIGGNIS